MPSDCTGQLVSLAGDRQEAEPLLPLRRGYLNEGPGGSLVPDIERGTHGLLEVFVRHLLVQGANQLRIFPDEVAPLWLFRLSRVDDHVRDDLGVGGLPAPG